MNLQTIIKKFLNVLLLPMTKIRIKIKQFANANNLLSRAIRWLNKKVRTLFVLKPQSRKEYFTWGNFLVYKKLVYLIILLLCLAPVVYFQFIASPLPTQQTAAEFEKSTYSDFIYDDYHLAVFSGRAKIYNKNKVLIYKGDVENGVCTGSGDLFDKYGNPVYSGQFEKNQYSGQGTLYYSDGTTRYVGEFKENLFNGEGKYYDTKGNLLYSGNFEKGLYQGKGTLYQYKGDYIYEGNFDKGNFSGKGTIYDNANNILFEGSFENNLYQGEGKLYNTSGVLLYEGNFDKGAYSGKGKLYDETSTRLVYEGDFLNGKRHGKGTAYKNGREYYTGSFFQDNIDYPSLLGIKLSAVSEALHSSYKIYTDGVTTAFTFGDFPIVFITDIQPDISAFLQQEQSETVQTSQTSQTSASETSSPDEKSSQAETAAQTEQTTQAQLDFSSAVVRKMIIMDNGKTADELKSTFSEQTITPTKVFYNLEDYALFYSQNLSSNSSLLFAPLKDDIFLLSGGNQNATLFQISVSDSTLQYAYKFVSLDSKSFYYTIEEKTNG